MFGRWLLFASSYSPLLALTAVRLEAGTYRTVLFCVAGVSALALCVALTLAKRISPRDRLVTSVEDRGADVAGYLATYLLPFLTVSEPRGRDALAYAGFLLLVGVVYTRSSLVAVNPLLYVVGYRLMFVTTESSQPLLLISRSRPTAGEVIRVRPLLVEHGICVQA